MDGLQRDAAYSSPSPTIHAWSTDASAATSLRKNELVTIASNAEESVAARTTEEDPSIDPDMKLLPAWKQFELDVHAHLQGIDRMAEIEHNAKREGLASRAQRQIDVLAERTVVGEVMRVVVECKAYKNPIDVGKVDEFVGKLIDVGANLGLLYALHGATPAAIRRAENSQMPRVTVRDLSEFFAGATPEEDSNVPPISLEQGWLSSAAEALGYESCPSPTCSSGVVSLGEWDPERIEAGWCDSCGLLIMRCPECECLDDIDVGTVPCYACGAKYHVGHDGQGNATTIERVVSDPMEKEH